MPFILLFSLNIIHRDLLRIGEIGHLIDIIGLLRPLSIKVRKNFTKS